MQLQDRMYCVALLHCTNYNAVMIHNTISIINSMAKSAIWDE